ncbi:glycosyltransferase family protein [Trichlorobacter ammonificans]|uniref:Spore protein YkvP/CgeB glycosyl transferase-like domain-containing protein n=1 Tax=Trichlorobacter ammonificans TaxID=2916410 RepID=A0ABM9DBK2_9BACT|nr:glycosyltransferase [Trichlorobacter ammonificans]CAH2032606.1 protein of unknown function [Trichlorobacter ammonificans]
MHLPKIAILGGHYLKNLCLPEGVWSCNLPLSIDSGADNSVQKLLRDQCPFQPDLLLFADQGCLPMLTGFDDLEVPCAAYLIDTHLHYCWHRHFAGMFDQVFAAQRNAAASLEPHALSCRWLPLFSRHGNLREQLPKEHDIVFVGTVDSRRNPERVGFLDAFARVMPLAVRSGDYRRPYNTARIILNQSVRNDLNFRVFEALASGGFLLTDDVGNGLELLFEPGRHLVTYAKGDVADATEKARYYLKHPEERECIAATGHARVVAEHTLAIRSQQLVALLTAHADTACPHPQRRGLKKLAAGRSYLAIALLMADLEKLVGSGSYGQRVGWYRWLAGEALEHHSTMETAGEEIMPDLALLAHLRGEAARAAAYARIALLNDPCNPELLLLAARISASRGDAAAASRLYATAVQVINDLRGRSSDQLLLEHLLEALQFCRRQLSS